MLYAGFPVPTFLNLKALTMLTVVLKLCTSVCASAQTSSGLSAVGETGPITQWLFFCLVISELPNWNLFPSNVTVSEFLLDAKQ